MPTRTRRESNHRPQTHSDSFERSRRSWVDDDDGLHCTEESISSPNGQFHFSTHTSSWTSPTAPSRLHFGLEDLTANLIHLVMDAQDSGASRSRPPPRASLRNGGLPVDEFPMFSTTFSPAGFSHQPRDVEGRPSFGDQKPKDNIRYKSAEPSESRWSGGQRRTEFSGSNDPAEVINEAESHRRKARRRRQRLELALHQHKMDSEELHRLIDEIDRHEKAFERLMARFKSLKSPRDPIAAAFSETSGAGLFDFPEIPPLHRTGHHSPLFSQPARPTRPEFPRTRSGPSASFLFSDDVFTAHDRLFNSNVTPPRPGRSAHRSSYSHPRPPSFVKTPINRATPSPLEKRSLHPEEAKALHEAYNKRWEALGPTDSNIPYPARGLLATSLLDRNTISAPPVISPVSTWSEETVMQANTQAFFLAAVGLAPIYTETARTGRVQTGFDRTRASPAQIESLLTILKKERTRWHSDRLGRRTGGDGGAGPARPNTVLQQSEQARAVFHAVCELLELAQ